MFTQLFTPILKQYRPCTIEEVRHSTQKERRIIDTLEPILNQHRLVVDEKLILKDFKETEDQKFQLFYQMTRLTKDRGSLAKDDRLDALAMAVAYWVEQMSKDTDSVLQEYKEELLRQELDRFMEHALGSKPGPNTWMET